VRRSHLVEDTITQMTFQHEGDDFKKPLKVIFDGEDGVDAGGVRKEFYQIVTRELLDPSYGMFKNYEETRYLWFNSDSFEANNEYELIGKLLGVAIYNSVIIDLRMPSLVYKKLKRQQLNLSDLEELQPQLAKGLRSLLAFKGDVKSVFELTFQITYERYGENVAVDLKENGAEIAVDETNRIEYVELYVDYILTSSVSAQYDAFERGFLAVCGGRALDLFDARELELLICGNPFLQLEVYYIVDIFHLFTNSKIKYCTL
jgi:ubiquitin-protein ligase E3 A